jgi:hypothetical protein
MADMIPVAPQPAPAEFEEKIRIPGLDWLRDKNIALDHRAPKKTKFEAFWTSSIEYAHEVYGGHCAYLATYLELATGEVTIDHYVSKMDSPRLAYEWSNYRLASLGANRAKGEKSVLDPFQIMDDWFHLELVSGRIFANPTLPEATQISISESIAHLKLDNGRGRKMRAQYFKDYKDGLIPQSYLQVKNPFVYAEAARQSLL